MKKKLSGKNPSAKKSVAVSFEPHPEALALVKEIKNKPSKRILAAIAKMQFREDPVPTLKHAEFNLLPPGALRIILKKPNPALRRFMRESQRELASKPGNDDPCVGGVYENPFLRKH